MRVREDIKLLDKKCRYAMLRGRWSVSGRRFSFPADYSSSQGAKSCAIAVPRPFRATFWARCPIRTSSIIATPAPTPDRGMTQGDVLPPGHNFKESESDHHELRGWPPTTVTVAWREKVAGTVLDSRIWTHAFARYLAEPQHKKLGKKGKSNQTPYIRLPKAEKGLVQKHHTHYPSRTIREGHFFM